MVEVVLGVGHRKRQLQREVEALLAVRSHMFWLEWSGCEKDQGVESKRQV